MRKTTLTAALLPISIFCMAQNIHYPSTPKDNTVDEYFGVKVADPYRWLENDTSKQTTAWVEEENAVTSAYLKKISMRHKLQ